MLGARFTRKAVDAVTSNLPWLFGLVGLAIALLALAALPLRATRGEAAAVLAHHRETIAFAGAGILIGATVAYALYALNI